MTRDDKGWWFKFDGDWYGPYETKAEATEDLRGLKRFQKYRDTPGFITTLGRHVSTSDES